MRQMEFHMERPGLLEVGQKVEITEGKLPSTYYYTIEPSLAMSGNYRTLERLKSREGVVVNIVRTPVDNYIVTVEFNE